MNPLPRIDRTLSPRPVRSVAPATTSKVDTPTAPGPSAPPVRSAGLGVVDAALAFGASAPRSAGPEGKEPILPPAVRARVQRALDGLGAAGASRLAGLLSGLHPTGRALVLRALAARADVVVDAGLAPSVLPTLAALADRLATLEEPEALRRSTALDLDSRTNTSGFDPLTLWSRRGQVRDPAAAGDVDADNDGLFQRFTGSCGSTVLQMMLAEADPVVALALHDEGLTSDATTGPAADFQRRVLEAWGGIALGRQEAQLRARLRNGLGQLVRAGFVDEASRDAVVAFALERGPRTAAVDGALGALRARYGGFPSGAELARLRADEHPARDEGIGTAAYVKALHEEVTPFTGVRYEPTQPEEGFARGQAWRHLDRVAAALKRGHDVPFGISEPAHWMLLSSVKGRKPRREFLVSDPDGGRTAWVGERSLLKGTFATDPFGLPEPGQRPYVDCFLFPVDG